MQRLTWHNSGQITSVVESKVKSVVYEVSMIVFLSNVVLVPHKSVNGYLLGQYWEM